MNDLKSHVESIVRPVRATQARKLRMRRELLVHLESAHAEELARDPRDAVARAARRLGDPAEISAQLQQSVPAFERLLLARIPTPRAYDNWESRASRRMLGTGRPMTMPHTSLVIAAAAVLPYAACLTLALRAGHPSTYLRHLADHPIVTLLCNAFFLFSTLSLFFVAARLVTATAAGSRTLPHAAVTAALLTATLLVCVVGLVRRPLAPGDLIALLIVIAALLAILHLTGRLLARLQHPYHEWLTLRLANN